MKILYTLLTTEPVDSLNINEKLAAAAEKLASTPADVIVSGLIDQATSFGLKVIAALILYGIGAWLIRKIKNILKRFFERKGTEPAISSFIQSLVSISLTVLLIIITIGTLGINTTSFAAVLTAGGMAIGMALSGTVQNFAGGIMLLIFKPFKSGDFIEALGFSGTVSEVNIVSTKLLSVDNRTLILPNGSLSNCTINNFSQNPIRRLEWKVDVEYGCSVEFTKSVIMDILKADSRILDKTFPGADDPFVRMGNMGQSGITFTARAWVKNNDYWNVNFDINETIYEKLPEKGIQFPYQQITVHINN